jgi:hypothetical protein
MGMLSIKQMSWAEKVQAMEELWESLSRDDDRLESHSWHADALEETRQSYAAGGEPPIEWEAAKDKLRTRSE